MVQGRYKRPCTQRGLYKAFEFQHDRPKESLLATEHLMQVQVVKYIMQKFSKETLG